ncbi:MAG TPA: ornithine cyclodeaminase family protein [Terriglobales bacterium]|nr:ornithine cyclodeaminase family protein [Terriglobales bacterium]
MTLLLTSEEAEQAMPMGACLDALEQSFRELAQGLAVNRPRSDTFTPTSEKDVYYRYKTMEGAVPGLGILAQRINSEKIRWPVVNGIRRQDKFQRVYPNYYVGLVLLFSIESGELLAILKEAYLQKMRVGGTSGLGIKYLARSDAQVIGLLGSGWQASAQLMAAHEVRKIQHVKVYSPNAENRRRFAVEMGRRLEVEIEPVSRPEEVAKGVDILLAATNSMEPVLFPQWVRPGMHVGSINTRRELARGLQEECDLVVVSTRDPKLQICVGGPKEGIAPLQEASVECGDLPELGDIIIQKQPGRQSDGEVTLFLNNIGLGTQFAAAGASIYSAARKKGLGREIPGEWFLETVRARVS